MPPLRALLVGVSYSGTDYNLAGCIPDIERLESFLQKRGVRPIRVLRDDRYNPGDDDYPSRTNVLAALAELLRQDSDVYVHFSGHGFYMGSSSTITSKGYSIAEETKQCILTRAARTPTLKDIGVTNTICDAQVQQLLNLLDRRRSAFITIDACSAGEMFDLPYNIQVRQPTGRARADVAEYIMRENRASACKHPNVAVLTAVREHKFAWDAKSNGKTYGLFTKVFVDALEAAAAESPGRGAALTYYDILYIIDRHLQNRENKQDPQLSVSSKTMAATQVILLAPTSAGVQAS